MYVLKEKQDRLRVGQRDNTLGKELQDLFSLSLWAERKQWIAVASRDGQERLTIISGISNKT